MITLKLLKRIIRQHKTDKNKCNETCYMGLNTSSIPSLKRQKLKLLMRRRNDDNEFKSPLNF